MKHKNFLVIGLNTQELWNAVVDKYATKGQGKLSWYDYYNDLYAKRTDLVLLIYNNQLSSYDTLKYFKDLEAHKDLPRIHAAKLVKLKISLIQTER